MRVLFLLRPGNLLPDVVSLPPTSIANVRKFFLRLASQSTPFYGVTVRLGLERTKNAGGIAYSRVTAQVGRRLSAEETNKVYGVAQALKPALQRVPARASEFAGEGDNGDAPY
jgi:hypothetical protein